MAAHRAGSARHALLDRQTDIGFGGPPRSFVTNEQGRHVVEWIEGDTTDRYRRRGDVDLPVEEVGRMIRRLHEAMADFSPPADERWNVAIEPDASD
ncbi:MAG: hypothetical protein ACXV8G_04655 [Acidimicrobiales bacterium]